MKRMIDLFADPLNAIFKELDAQSAPWHSEYTSEPLDMIYFYHHSGDKIAGAMLLKLEGTDGHISAANLTKICAALLAMYGDKWTKIYTVLKQQYDPLKNYDMTESGVDTSRDSGKDTNKRSGSLDRSGAITRTGSEKDTGSNANNKTQTDTGIYGFNSGSSSPSDQSTIKSDVDLTHTYTNVKDEDTRKDTYNNITDELSHGKVNTLEHTLSRSGNIGVTTSQQMLESELNLRAWLYFENVMQDIDKMLCLSIY